MTNVSGPEGHQADSHEAWATRVQAAVCRLVAPAVAAEVPEARGMTWLIMRVRELSEALDRPVEQVLAEFGDPARWFAPEGRTKKGATTPAMVLTFTLEPIVAALMPADETAGQE